MFRIPVPLPDPDFLVFHTPHSSIKMTPVEASKKKNEGTVYFNLYGDMETSKKKPKFKIGDKVKTYKKYKKVQTKRKSTNGMYSTRVTHQTGQKKCLQLIRSNTLIQ